MSTPPGFSPDSPLGRLLGQVGQFIQQERFADAIPLMREASELQPDNARIQTDLGGLYMEAGQPEAALAPLRRAIALNPRVVIAHWRLGTVLHGLNDPAGAIRALEDAVRLQPSLSDAHYRLGLLYREQGRLPDALESYRRAALTETDPVMKRLFQAQVLMLEARDDEAEPLLRAALQEQPDMAQAQALLGEILAGSGRFDEAARCYEALIAQWPRAGTAYYDLVRCRKIVADDSDLLRRMDAALERDDLDDMDRSSLLLARGKAFDDLGRYERAMSNWDAAYAVRARAVSFDIDAFERQVVSIIANFGAETLALVPPHNADRTPVLILGMPRSGTTLVEQIVASHPAAAGAGELAFWKKRLAAAFERAPADLDGNFIASTAGDYLEELRFTSQTALRVTDKDPFNFLAIGLIHLCFPQAAIIHCRRSPIDTALSIHQTRFAPAIPFPTGGSDLVRYTRAYLRLMAHWRSVLPEGRMFEVDYETLTASPEAEIRKIIGYVGLAWDDSCLKPQDNMRMVRTPSRWQVRQPINTGSVERWRRYEPWLGPLAALVDGER